jgi:RNA polymerase sigma factor (sigma-70 family)
VTESTEWASYVSGLLSIEGKLRICLGRFTRNRADTDELVQESYARLLSIDPETMRQIRSVPGFALVVSRRIALDWLKHQKALRIDSLPDDDVFVHPSEDTFTEDLVNCYQEIERLLTNVGQLPPKCRQVFTLRKMFGFTQKEVGRLLDVTVHTVEQHMLKATRTLRGSLGGQKESSPSLPLLRRKSQVTRRAPRIRQILPVSRQIVSS